MNRDDPTDDAADRSHSVELFDAWIAGTIDEEQVAQLERSLLSDPRLRDEFVRYVRMHEDLDVVMRSERASEESLRRLGLPQAGSTDAPRRSPPRLRRISRVAALLVGAVTIAALSFAAGRRVSLSQGAVDRGAPGDISVRTAILGFDAPATLGLADSLGRSTGLTHRLPGTGLTLDPHDPNLRLDVASGCLELRTTNSDINHQVGMGHGEYLGVRLADLSFRGSEDFEVSVTIPDIPALEKVGQFGLYVGTASDRNIRGGLISRAGHGEYSLFLVNNADGVDRDAHLVGLLTRGDDLRISLARTGGRYAMTVANTATGSSSTVAIRHPSFLDGEDDLYVGIFGANTQSEVRRVLRVDEFAVRIGTLPAPGFDPDSAVESAPLTDSEPATDRDTAPEPAQGDER